MPGAGGRCNDWTYTTNHISDGEYVDLTSNGGGGPILNAIILEIPEPSIMVLFVAGGLTAWFARRRRHLQ